MVPLFSMVVFGDLLLFLFFFFFFFLLNSALLQASGRDMQFRLHLFTVLSPDHFRRGGGNRILGVPSKTGLDVASQHLV